MSDTMCKGGECPDKNKCKRYLAKPDPYWQSWFANIPYNPNGATIVDNKVVNCAYFLEVSK